MAGNRRAAGAVEHGEKGALAGQRRGAFRVIDRGDERAGAGIVGAGLGGNDALPARRKKFVDGENGGTSARKAEPLEAGEREQGGVDLAGGKLAQAGLDVAAE